VKLESDKGQGRQKARRALTIKSLSLWILKLAIEIQGNKSDLNASFQLYKYERIVQKFAQNGHNLFMLAFIFKISS